MKNKYDTIVLFGDSGSKINEIVRYTSMKESFHFDDLEFLKKYNRVCILPVSVKNALSLQNNLDFMQSALFVTVVYEKENAIHNLCRINQIEYDEASEIISQERELINQIPRIDVIVYANKDNSPVELATQVINKILPNANISDPRQFEFQEYKCMRSMWKKQNIDYPSKS